MGARRAMRGSPEASCDRMRERQGGLAPGPKGPGPAAMPLVLALPSPGCWALPNSLPVEGCVSSPSHATRSSAGLHELFLIARRGRRKGGEGTTALAPGPKGPGPGR